MAKNAFFLTVASVGQKLLSFVYFLLLAKFLQPEKTGVYSAALTLVTTFSVIADLGVPPVVIRDVAKDPTGARGLIRRALAVKLPATLLAIPMAVGASFLLGYEADARLLVLLAGGILVSDSLSAFFYGVLRGLQQLSFEAIGMFTGQVLTLAAGGLALLLHPTLPTLVLTLTLGSAFNAVLSAVRVGKALGWRTLLPLWDAAGMRAVAVTAFPFFLAATFVKLYSTMDIQFLKVLLGNAAVGLYSVAYKFTYAFQFLPLAFVAALYPGMSALAGAKDADGLGRLFDRALRYMLLLAVPLAFGLSAISDRLVRLVDASYAPAAPVLALLAFALLPSFLDFPIGSLLNATGRQAAKTMVFGLTLVVNAALNFLLIPRFGLMGAAAASVASLAFLVTAGSRFIPTIIQGYQFRRAGRIALPIFLSGVAMYAAARGLSTLPFASNVFALVVTVCGAAVVYVGLLFLTRAASMEDVRALRALLRRSPHAARVGNAETGTPHAPKVS